MIIFRSTAILLLFLITSFSHAQEGRSMQGAFGTVTIDGKMWNQIVLRPVLPVWKFAVALDLVIYFDQDGNIHKDEWDSSNPEAVSYTHLTLPTICSV